MKDGGLALVVFGPQGSGKSTQVERLAQSQRLVIFEAGEELRQRARDDIKIRDQITKGVLVEDEVMRTIIEEFIKIHPSQTGYIFDGYPRDLIQFQGFQTLVRKYGWHAIGIFINLSDESAKKRLSERYQIIDGKKIKRPDDNPDTVQKRLNTFRIETLPLKDNFSNDFELLEINGEPSVDEVTDQIRLAVDQIFNDEN